MIRSRANEKSDVMYMRSAEELMAKSKNDKLIFGKIKKKNNQI